MKIADQFHVELCRLAA
ncbi:protein YrbN, partial [Escherichia coli]